MFDSKFKSNRFICFLVAGLILVLCTNGINAENTSFMQQYTADELADIKEESDSLNIASDFLEEYTEDQFGGMFIDENNNLNIYVLESDELQTYQLFSDSNVILHTGKYSLEDLKNYADNAITIIQENENIFNEIYLDESINKVIVELCKSYDYSPDVLKYLKSIDAYEIKYVEGTVEFREEASVGPGTKVADGSSSTFTIAFPAKRNNVVGFVTAGHCINYSGTLYSSTGTSTIGRCTARTFNASTDAAFVSRTNTAFTPTATTQYSGYELDGLLSDFIIQGVTVHLEGASSGDETGTITSTYSSVYDYGAETTYTQRIKTSCYSQTGDSGAPLWVGRFLDNSSVYARCIVGVHTGSVLDSSNTRQGEFATRIDNVIDSLSVSFYDS